MAQKGWHLIEEWEDVHVQFANNLAHEISMWKKQVVETLCKSFGFVFCFFSLDLFVLFSVVL